jgi:predicted metal-binding membrane protein
VQAVDEMPMPGASPMSMAWMRMPGQTWPDAAASFLGMWVVMMVAMMLPSLVPMLWRYRQAVGRPMAILLGLGVMDLRAMTVVAAGITVERLAPSGERVARAIGAVVVVAGLLLIA